MTRGLQKKALQSTKLSNGKYLRSELQKARYKEKRLAGKVEKLKAKYNKKIEHLQEEISIAQQKECSIVPHNSPNSNYNKFDLVISMLINQKITNQSIMGFRNLQPKQTVDNKSVAIIPSRTTITNTTTAIALGTEISTKYSDMNDCFVIDTTELINQIITASNWDKVGVRDPNSDEYRNMIPLSIGGTSDAGRLTKLKGMIIQGIKILTPSIFPTRNTEVMVSQEENHTNAEWQQVQSANNILLCGFCQGEDNKITNKRFDLYSFDIM